MEQAGFGVRFLALIIDSLILASVSVVMNSIGLEGVYNKLSMFVGAFYAVFFWVNKDGATLGKKVMKIKVVTEKGTPITYQTAILRYVGYIASSLPLGLGFFWVLWDDKKQGFHDKIASTFVVKA